MYHNTYIFFFITHKIPEFQPRVPQKPSPETNSVLPEPYARLLKPTEKLKLIKEHENVVNELRDKPLKTYQHDSRETQQPILWTKLIQSVIKMDNTVNPIMSDVQTNLILDNESERSFNEKHVFDDVIQLTTIVKRIRQRNKRSNWPMNRSINGVNTNMNSRFKRSVIKVDDSKINNNSSDVTEKSTPTTEKIYGHSKLTHQDRETQKDENKFSDVVKENNTNPNEFTEFYKRIWDIINGTRPRFKIVVPPIKESRRTFKDEHTARASASEVEDLNLPYNKTGEKKSLEGVPFDDRRPSKEDEFEKYAKAEVEGVEDRSTLMPFGKLQNQKHDPDEVDENYNYSSSESLNEGTKTTDRTTDSTEEIDLSVENLNLSLNQAGSLNENKKSSPIQESLSLVPASDKPVNEDQEIYDPDKIPYVEVPDYEDVREKSLDEEDRRQAEKKNIENPNVVNSFDCVGNANADSSTNSEEGRKHDFGNINLESYETATNEDSTKELENPKNVQDRVNNSKKNENGGEEEQPREDEESNEESVLSIIPFDINEYRKPFNLHDFFKNEPFFATLGKTKDYVREGSDQDEVTEGANYSTAFEDNVNLDFSDVDEQDSRNERILQDHSNRDVHDTKTATESEEVISEDLYRYGDKNFFKQLFEENRKKRENFQLSAEEEDFLDRYFTKDVIKKLKEDSSEELRETKKNEMIEKYKNKNDALKDLKSILAKKDQISRLDETVNKEIEDGKNTPSVYKNYWSLEYDLPGKNDRSLNENKTASL